MITYSKMTQPSDGKVTIATTVTLTVCTTTGQCLLSARYLPHAVIDTTYIIALKRNFQSRYY